MNWLTALAIAVLLLSTQYDASPATSKSPWADPAKASSFMDCLITKIIESEVFPQQEKEDLKSIMDTLMSAINGSSARGQSSGAQLQAINMAIASSLAEIVVSGDEGNPKGIIEKTQDLAGGLEKCFESVMGTIDRKFISEISDLISMFAKEAASEINEPKDEEDPSNLSDAQSTPTDAGDEAPKSAPNDVELEVPKPAPTGIEPQVSEPESIGVEPQVPQTLPEPDLRSGVPQQTIRTPLYPNRSSSLSFLRRQSAANKYQSSQTSQESSQTAGGYGEAYRGSQISELSPINAGPQVSQSVPVGVGRQGLQTSSARIWRVGNEMMDASSRRTFLRSGVPQQTTQTVVHPDRSSLSSFQTTSQSADNTYQSSQAFQGSSQMSGEYGRTYSGPQFPEPTPTDVEPQNSQAAPELISRVENDLVDTSTRRGVLTNGVPQQTVPTAVYPNRLSSSSFQTSQSADNTYQSSQTYQDSSQMAGGYREEHSGSQMPQPAPIAFGPQIPQLAPERVWKVGNEIVDTSAQRSILRSSVPQQTIPTAVYPNRSASSTFQTTSRSADNTYQSSQTYQGSSQTADGYREEYSGAQMPQPAPNDFGPQVPQSAPGRSWRVGKEMVDTSTQRSILRSGVPQQFTPTSVYPNRSSSSSFQTSQSAANNYQSSQTFQGSSQRAGGYGRINSRPEYFKNPPIAAAPPVSKPVPIDVSPQRLQAAPGFISREANKLTDTSTRRAVLRSGVPQQTVPTAVYPNSQSSSSFQTTSQSSDNTYQSRQTSQSSSQTANGYGRTYRGPKYSETTPISVRAQLPQTPPIGMGPPVSQAAPGHITRVTDELADTSTRRAVSRSGVRQQSVPIAVYPNRSSFQTTNQSADKTFQSTQTFQGSSQRADESRGIYRRPQVFESTQNDVGPQVLQAAPRFTSRTANNLADTSTRRGVLRSSVRQQTVPIAKYPNRSSFQTTSQSDENTYQTSQTFQGSSQTAGGHERAYSRSQISQPERIDVGPQISNAPPALAPSPASQEASCTTPLPEISVLPTLNSPNGLRSDSAGVRINQLISAVLNAIGPSGVDANTLARSLQESVSNLRSSGMSSSDAKLEVLLELIVGLLHLVSNAQISEINMTTASAVTSAAARCFELALA